MFLTNSNAIVPKIAVITTAPATPITIVAVVITVFFNVLCPFYYQLRAKLHNIL